MNDAPAHSTPSAGPRQSTAVDAIAEQHAEASIRLSPVLATSLGIPGYDDQLDDLSPAGYAANDELAATTLAALDQAQPVDEIDRVTIAAMRERLELQRETSAAGFDRADVNVIASPLQMVRDILDLMPTDTDEQWANIASRLNKFPTAMDQWAETLRQSATAGRVSAARQYRECITQIEQLTADGGYFASLAGSATLAGDAALAASVRSDLEAGSSAARRAFADTADLFRELLAQAPEQDAVGVERYQLESRNFLGARVDLAETYAWGQEELARILSEMQRTADEIKPGATLDEAIAHLKADPRYQLHGTEALQAWMQERSDEAIRDLGSTHFDIAEPLRNLACRIAPTNTGGIYYTGPSDDFSRPGSMWWSVPEGVTTFHTWSELTTVYHEGVPGHHLQVAQATYQRELLNSWRRGHCWVSGHGEGWALYAERLMRDLGYLDDPANYLGMLDAQALRSARVVLDIGFHCGFEAPAELGGGAWDYDKAWTFLTRYSHESPEFLRFELNRYLGWPGQAPSYKVGERLWLQLRDEAQAAAGENFSMKEFHRKALDIGSVGLDVLRQALVPQV